MSEQRWIAKSRGAPDVLEKVGFEPQTPKPSEVVLKVLATTATYTDLLIIAGNYRPNFPLPVTPGYDMVGVVKAVGSSVTTVKVGDTVVSMPQHGCMATEVVIPEKLCVKIDQCTDPEKMVSIVLTGVTAYQMLHRVAGQRIGGNASILVHGAAGGTGAMFIQLAKLAGIPAANIFGTCRAKNMEAVAGLGATPLDYEAAGDGAWDAQVRARTGGRGVEAVFDAVMLKGYYARGLACLSRGGVYVGYGFTDAAQPGAISVPSVLSLFARIFVQQNVASWFSGKQAVFYNVAERRDKRPGEFADDVRRLASMVEGGQLDVVIGRVWGLEGAKEALQSIARGEHRGKQVICVA